MEAVTDATTMTRVPVSAGGQVSQPRRLRDSALKKHVDHIKQGLPVAPNRMPDTFGAAQRSDGTCHTKAGANRLARPEAASVDRLRRQDVQRGRCSRIQLRLRREQSGLQRHNRQLVERESEVLLRTSVVTSRPLLFGRRTQGGDRWLLEKV